MNQVETTPVAADTHIPDRIVHKFCPCQWADEPAVAQAMCGEVLPINGRRASPDKAKCGACLEVVGVHTCPVCGWNVWAG